MQHVKHIKAKSVTKGNVLIHGFVHLLKENSAFDLARVEFGFCSCILVALIYKGFWLKVGFTASKNSFLSDCCKPKKHDQGNLSARD